MALVEFIIPTDGNRTNLLTCILSSLRAQTNVYWEANVVVDGPWEVMANQALVNVTDHRIRFTNTGKKNNDWGHTPRDLGRMDAHSQYTIMTGDDNYYVPTFVEELSKVIGDSPGFVYWDMVHSSFNYQYFKCTPGNGQIDIGAFAVRTDLCKQVPLGRDYAADGQFVEDYKKMFPHEKMVKIDKVLYIHN